MIATLIIEKSEAGFQGRIHYRSDLIVAEETSIEKLEIKMGKLLNKHYLVDLSTLKFQHRYDLTALFEKFDFLKISAVAKMAGINDSLLRQYVTGNKQASAVQAQKIENTIHRIGRDLVKVQVGQK